MKALADLLGKSKQAANSWKKQVPAELCPLIEHHTGVPCEELRPDVKWSVLRKKPKG
jgi:DNA-binding transcriptional regulator YdaS (Cro superfamily)